MDNKRGQGLTIGTLILIILGIAVLVVLIVGFTQGFGFITDLFRFGPSDLEQVTQACVGYVRGGLYNDYCKTFRELNIGESKQFVNCQNPEIEIGVEADVNVLNCGSRFGSDDFGSASNSGNWYCKDLLKRDKVRRGTKANGIACFDKFICADIIDGNKVGTLQGKDVSCAGVKVSDGLTDLVGNNVCCIFPAAEARKCEDLIGTSNKNGVWISAEAGDTQTSLNARCTTGAIRTNEVTDAKERKDKITDKTAVEAAPPQLGDICCVPAQI